MAIQSANATVLSVRRIAPLSISQLYFASIVISLRNGLPPRQAQLPRLSGTPEVAPGVPCGVTGSCSASYIRANSRKVPLRFSEYWPIAGIQWQAQIMAVQRVRRLPSRCSETDADPSTPRPPAPPSRGAEKAGGRSVQDDIIKVIIAVNNPGSGLT